VPLNVTLPCELPKLAPEIVTCVPIAPEVGLRLVILGPTVNVMPLLAWPPTVTTIGPVSAPFGTGTMMRLAFQLVGVPAVPLKLTMLEPGELPKLLPVIVTDVPTTPDEGFKPVMEGGDVELPLPAARKATSCMIQLPAGDCVAVAV